jgi:hypothetical protein
VAYGELELTPEAFRQFTPRELQWRIDGYVRRDARAFHQFAWLAATVIGPFVKGRLSADRLIGRVGQTALPPVPAHLLPPVEDED